MSESHIKRAETDHDVLPQIAARYSPYVFEPKPVAQADLLACLEAARWAASSFNEQPWVFLVARREDAGEFEKMLGCLYEANRNWAKNAGVLMVTAVAKHFTKNDKPNRVAEHDLGLAMGNFTMQAESLGLAVHQMAGIDLDAARAAYSIPAMHNPMTAIAVGYAGDPNTADNDQLAERDKSPRTRKQLKEFVFGAAWRTAFDT